MGVFNSIVQFILRKKAKKLAKWAAETYPVVKTQNPQLNEKEIHMRMFTTEDELKTASKEIIKNLYIQCQSINGVCYLVALTEGFNEWSNFRIIQFTNYMDQELIIRGFEPQTKETKKQILNSFNIPNYEVLI